MSLAVLFHFLCAQHVSDINPYPANVENMASSYNASKWQMGFNSAFKGLIYPSSGACDYSVELPHWSSCSWFDLCWRFGVVGLEWYPFCRLQCPKHIEHIRSEIK